jgi:hypothetical protein
MILAVALQCGHVTYGEVGPDWFTCPDCVKDVKPQAFETREWHAKCQVCRYGRWFGQDKDSANKAHPQHFCAVHFMANPKKKDAVRKVYGRRVRIIIVDLIVPARWPDVRSVIAKPIIDNPDIPPF